MIRNQDSFEAGRRNSGEYGIAHFQTMDGHHIYQILRRCLLISHPMEEDDKVIRTSEIYQRRHHGTTLERSTHSSICKSPFYSPFDKLICLGSLHRLKDEQTP